MNEKSWVYKWMEPAFGTGLVTSSAEKSKFRRKLLTPCFHPNILRKYFKVFIEESEKLLVVLEEETNKEFTCIENFITLCVIDITVETMFGSSINALRNGSSLFKKSIERALNLDSESECVARGSSMVPLGQTIFSPEFSQNKPLFVGKNVEEEVHLESTILQFEALLDCVTQRIPA
ncbi:hypothetical protein AVEN_80763-1 [Araneus ventricosus]|uniref:Uncharacterized protein n=1 Tax=Araneus ventricosus TaxID=182803 RepID=A0A4Y2WES7_ARAVE|nr:hypothetical protein AVEN_80763-1 [Araneus ventricosus]